MVSVAGSSGGQTCQTEVSAVAGRIAEAERAARAAVAVAGPSAGRAGGTAAASAALTTSRTLAAQSLAHPVAVVRVVEAGAASGQIPSGFVLSSPGMLVNFIMFSMLTAGVALIVERGNFTLLRLMTTRVRRWSYRRQGREPCSSLRSSSRSSCWAWAQLLFASTTCATRRPCCS